eukprot:TRINITY_DN74080_c0_g1_i1.p1 TRINITY_DN74080_c0_g1~~TRINITY_DN74080_c0_g1_i1.p1  ORF type:complete len:328 (+),score=81.21 TRINITY_DN74080_c0_g1_i1:30-1013(+)
MGCGASSAKYDSNGQLQQVPDKSVEATTVQEVPAGETAISPKSASGQSVPNSPTKSANHIDKAASSASSPPKTHAKKEADLPGAGATGGSSPAPSPNAWWSLHTDWIRDRSREILGAYNFFFEHIGIRKGWRTPPFGKEEVQAPFMASAEVVAVVRRRIDEQGGGMVLRQLEGSAMDFLWGWCPEKPPGQALEEFFRGLVFATLSDAKGLVEGLDAATVDYYVRSHPILESSKPMTMPAGEALEQASAPKVAAPAEVAPAVQALPAQESPEAHCNREVEDHARVDDPALPSSAAGACTGAETTSGPPAASVQADASPSLMLADVPPG